MFDPSKTQEMFELYAIPWAINIAMALLIFFVGRLISKMIVSLIGKLLSRSNMDSILVDFIQSICNAILLLFVIVAALDRLGVDTTSMVAVLGAAGLAIGLSLQSSLQNFAAGVMLLVFRPFKSGDFVEAGGVAGVVETISIFTSTFRTGDNKEVIVPNGSIYGGNIINYSARPTRRVDMVFGISYDDDIRKAKAILEEVVKNDSRIHDDPAPKIAVSELGDNSVNIIVRPWANSADYWDVFFDTTEKVKLRFDEEGITIPYPQIDVHMPERGQT